MTESKAYGRVYTPNFIVNLILDQIGYNTSSNVIGKHIIDNSCGDGAFLIEIIKRYCECFVGSIEELTQHLQTYIHGIEIDFNERNKCIANLNSIISSYGVKEVDWDIICADTLSVSKYNSQMDYVVGNPPYVRVHNLDNAYNTVKSYKFANGGMTDIYLVFFEIGFNMLKPNGQLCYITPSSWLSSLAADNLRRYIVQNQNLIALIDLEHFQAFAGITTYTIISQFKKSYGTGNFNYYTYNSEGGFCQFVEQLNIKDISIDSCFYLGGKKSLETLRRIKTTKCNRFVSVKNGFATLADSVFIGNDIPESSITIRVLKGSTGKWYKCIFPYDENGKALSETQVFEDNNIKTYLLSHREALLKGREEYAGWYLFGRTQALADVYRIKLSINSLVKTKESLMLVELMSGEGVYSGLYVVTNFDIPLPVIKKIIASDDFINYVKLLKKYKNGGYYTFNTKDVEQYINYHLSYKEKNYTHAIQPTFSRQGPELFQGIY